MPHYLLVKERLKGLRKAGNQSYRTVVRRIGAVTFFRDRLNVSKLPARRIGRSRKTQTKEFDQAGSEFESTVFEIFHSDASNVLSSCLNMLRTREAKHCYSHRCL